MNSASNSDHSHVHLHFMDTQFVRDLARQLSSLTAHIHRLGYLAVVCYDLHAARVTSAGPGPEVSGREELALITRLIVTAQDISYLPVFLSWAGYTCGAFPTREGIWKSTAFT